MKKSTKKLARRSITPRDILSFKLVAAPRISPDGEQVVFTLKTVGEKNDYQTNLWMVGAERGEARQFTSGNKDSAPAWSPDGSRIAFVRGREKQPSQIYVIDVQGGEAVALTSLPEGSIGRFVWAPDGRSLAVSFREQDPDWTTDAEKARKEAGLSTPPRVIDDLWHKLDGDGYFGAQRYKLYVVDADSGRHRLLYGKDTIGGFDFDFSPDSKQLVVSTNRDKKAMLRPWKDELLIVDAANGKISPIPNLPVGPKTCVRWSPDGKWIAFAGQEGKEEIYSVENIELYVCDPRGRSVRSLTHEEDRCLMAIAIADTSEAEFAPVLRFNSDSDRIFAMYGYHGEMHIASVAVTGGKIEFHTSGAAVHDMGNTSRDGSRMALLRGSATELAEVCVADCSRKKAIRIRQRTDFNGPLQSELQLAEPESHWIEAEDGHRVHVWSMLPAGKKSKKMPAVLEVHGGPHAQYGCGFFHEFQVLAAAGYAVFYSNPRGSKGYGRDHCAAIKGDWGNADWLDVQAVTRFMQQHPAVDRDRIGIMGGSYGGYMTNWAIGHCQDFAAAISDRCVSNLVSMSGNSDFVMQPDDYFPGNAWDRPEERWRQSPLAHFANAKTPTLVIHSEGDLRCNIEQSEQVFTALKVLGVPTRLVRYPLSTSHGMSRQGPPDLRIHRLEQILAWWKKYLQR